MGLDQYLCVRQYFGGYDHNEEKKQYMEIATASGMEDLLSDKSPSIHVSGCAVYWRKANAIHGWFVGLAGGVDECQEIEVDKEHLIELRDACKSVLLDNSLSEKLLPPTVGFFFGSTKVDEYYLQDLIYTAKELDRLLEMTETESVEFYYQASW
jgi:hypothetical protein